ncbi:MAG: WYL domain-containing protein [Acetobacteraceae bacterium]|nr:WYL domain-containing protein [Acetobacteraceae bacterium]
MQEVASQLGVARQTVYRLRDKAQVLGVWVCTHEEDPEVPKGCMRLEAPQEVEATFRMTLEEVEALKAAVARIQNLTPLARQALARLERVEWSLAQEEPVIYTPLADEYPRGLFERVVRAIRERRVCEVTYKNARGQVKSYFFDPYALVARDPHLYLVGANHNSRRAGHDPVKDLRLDQVQSLKLTRKRFPEARL